jgi:oligosaccharide repeat unit polymerase
MLELAIIIHILLAAVNYKISVNKAYPPLLYSLLWLLILLSFFMVKEFDVIEIYPLSGEICAIFVAGSIIFSLGGIVSTLLYFDSGISSHKEPLPYQFELNKIFDTSLFIIPLVFLPVFLLRSWQIYDSSNIGNFFVGLRTELVYGEENYGPLKYLITLAVFNSTYRFALNSDTKSKKFKLIISLFIAVVYAIFSTSRTAFFFLLLTILGLKIFRSQFKLRHVALFTFIILTIYTVFDLMLAKAGSFDDPLLDNLGDIQIIFLQYLLGPLSAFDRFLSEPSYLHFGDNVFRTIYVLLYNLGISSAPPTELIQEFIPVPFLTNVYTIYYTYILDFGIIGAVIFIFLFGLIHSSLFYKAKTGHPYYIYFYAILVHPLITSFFNDQYFSILSHWIQYFILGTLTFKYFLRRHPDNFGTIS